MNNLVKSVFALALIATPGIASAQAMDASGRPVQDVSARRHGNLAAAQAYVGQAFDRLSVAQTDNRYQLGGHAARAKALLRQANQEISLAAASAR